MSEILYDQVKAAQYMARLLRAKHFNIEEGDNFFDYIRGIGGNLKRLLRGVIEDVKDSRGSISEKENLLNSLFHTQGSSLNCLGRNLCTIAEEYPYIKTFIMERSLKICDEISKYQTSDAKNYEVARKKFETIFGFSRDALDFLEFTYIYKTNDYVDYYLNNDIDVWKARNRKILACIVDMDISRLDDAIDELETCQILKINTGNGFGLGVELRYTAIKIFEHPDINPKDLFCAQMRGETLPLDNFNIPKEDLNYIIRLLKSKSSAPVHIMLYGPPGTGKTALARHIAHELDRECFIQRASDCKVALSVRQRKKSLLLSVMPKTKELFL